MNYNYAEEPYLSPQGTVLPRHIAGAMDNLLSMLLAVVVAKQLDDNNAIMQLVVAVAVYLLYYLFWELTTSRSIGKFATGLKVVNVDGGRCTFQQILIRTLFRLLEVNPFVGMLPAAASIIFSRHKQRFGDKYANTFVVFSQ